VRKNGLKLHKFCRKYEAARKKKVKRVSELKDPRERQRYRERERHEMDMVVNGKGGKGQVQLTHTRKCMKDEIFAVTHIHNTCTSMSAKELNRKWFLVPGHPGVSWGSWGSQDWLAAGF